MTEPMHHQAIIKRALAELHEDWMDDADKALLDAEALKLYGAQLEADIDAGIANGYSAEQQEQAMRAVFRAFRPPAGA